MDELVRVSHGIWRPPSEIVDFSGRCLSLLAGLPPSTVVGGLAAAYLHRLWLPVTDPPLPEFVLACGPHRPSESAGSRRRELRLRRCCLRDAETTVVEGVPVTTDARTWVDLAEVLRPADLVAAGDCVLRGGTEVSALDAAVRAAVGRRGIRRAREVLPYLDAGSRSRPESHLRYCLVAAGLPRPIVNEQILDGNGDWLAEPDLHYREARVALEYNGADHATVGRMRRDITRELDIEAAGWRCVVFGPAEVFRRPDSIVGLVRSLRDQRDPRWRRRNRDAT